MEEFHFPAKLKRKDLDEVSDDFCDFSLSSPARKIRRLDVDLPPIIEEEEMVSPVVSGNLPVNEERAIVRYDPMNNMPSLQSRSPFSISVSSDFLAGFKNPVLWSKRSNLLESLNGKIEKREDNSAQNNRNMAVVPWVPMNSQHQTVAEVSEMMDADDIGTMIMDIEEDNNNSQQIPKNEFGSVSFSNGVNQWQQQQHCMIPQPPHNLSTPISWSGTGV